MQCKLRIWPLALLAAILLSSESTSAWAARNGRSLVANRQKVRARLAAAMADGALSRMEQYAILLQAKELLPPDELRGLQYTLDRLATPQKAPVPAAHARTARGKPVDDELAPEKASQSAASAGLDLAEEDKRARSASYSEPTPADAGESPFKEELEDAEETVEPIREATPDLAYEELADEGLEELITSGNVFDGFYMAPRFNRNDVRLFTTVDGFKGPLDLDNQNGNFGLCFGINAGFPAIERLGLGFQAGTSAVLSDLHGTQFTGSRIRSQNFTTIGIFQRLPLRQRRLKWGFTYDWLYDHYYSTFSMSQWRVKIAYDWNPCNEVGIWACIPDRGDLAALGDGTGRVNYDFFKPIPQGNLYLRHLWESGATTTTWMGIAEEPGEFVFGADGRIPISRRLAFVGGFNYVLPDASGIAGQDEEQWNVSLGIELLPSGCGYDSCQRRFTPMFPLANNGTFAFRRF